MTPDPRPALLNAALDAAARGWPVIPLRPGSKRPALHGESVCPRVGECADGHRKWEQRATTDPARIHAAWQHAPYNIGIATGPARLLVIDLDQPKNGKDRKGKSDAPCGAATFKALCERAGRPVPETYRVRTASGGEHLYFDAPPGARLSNSAGRLGALIDTRAWGGYVVAPGSIIGPHRYEVIDPRPVAALPEWLYAALTVRQFSRGVMATPSPGRASRYVSAALEGETRAVRVAHEGQRDATLLRAARALGRFVAWGDLPRHVVEQALEEAGQGAGLPARQCRSTIRTALDWSIANNTPATGATT